MKDTRLIRAASLSILLLPDLGSSDATCARRALPGARLSVRRTQPPEFNERGERCGS